MDYYEVIKKLADNGYSQGQMILCGEDTYLRQYTREGFRDIWFFYRHRVIVKLFLEPAQAEIFDYPLAETHWTGGDIQEFAVNIGGIPQLNEHQGHFLLRTIEEEVREMSLAAGSIVIKKYLKGLKAIMESKLADAMIQKCHICSHAIGIMPKHSDPTLRDKPHPAKDLMHGTVQICGICVKRFEYVKCCECKLWTVEPDTVFAPPIEYYDKARMCKDCDKIHTEGWIAIEWTREMEERIGWDLDEWIPIKYEVKNEQTEIQIPEAKYEIPDDLW